MSTGDANAGREGTAVMRERVATGGVGRRPTDRLAVDIDGVRENDAAECSLPRESESLEGVAFAKKASKLSLGFTRDDVGDLARVDVDVEPFQEGEVAR
mgnify:FL=1